MTNREKLATMPDWKLAKISAEKVMGWSEVLGIWRLNADGGMPAQDKYAHAYLYLNPDDDPCDVSNPWNPCDDYNQSRLLLKKANAPTCTAYSPRDETIEAIYRMSSK